MSGKAALIYVLGFGFILGYISMNLSEIAKRAQGNMGQYAAAMESHNLAVSGANIGLARFYQDTSWRGSVTQVLTSGPFRGECTYTISNLSSGRPRLRSISRCMFPDGVLRDTVEVSFGPGTSQSFTLFAWMSNFEGNMFWNTGDTVWGRIHSNGNIHMQGRPVFMEKVTTSKGFNPKWGSGTNNAIFKQGFETGIAEIEYPTDISEIVNAASSGGRAYVGNIEVELGRGTMADNDGYILVSKGGALIDSISISDATFNGALLGTGRVDVKGTLDGKLTIASLTDLYVTDDVVYENRDISTSNDLLGLVSNQSVIIGNTGPNQANCEIDGSIFARAGSFIVEDYNSGAPRGELRVHGSIVQNTRGQAGTYHVGHGTIKTGYYERYRYDLRLQDPNFRPPFYPGFYAQTFTIASWWESVHIPEFN